MSDGDKKYWFRAKRYGWGWGLPLTWQGWVVFVVWFAVLICAIRYLIPRRPTAFLICTLGMSLLLLAICYEKGEPARWRWGERDE
jgi:branched-subunit amino acid ABC-type transport system permease component